MNDTFQFAEPISKLGWQLVQAVNFHSKKDKGTMRPFSRQQLHSEKNGEIKVTRWIGKPDISVNGYFQSGNYMQSLWRNGLKHVTLGRTGVRKVLLLGLGGGSALDEIHTRFRLASTTIFEWDIVMVELAHRLNLFSHHYEPEIVVGDAVESLLTLKTFFDVVLVDLYTGQAAEPRLYQPKVVASIANVLSDTGQLVLNAFEDTKLVRVFARHMDFVSTWRFRNNQLALYQKFAEQPPVF